MEEFSNKENSTPGKYPRQIPNVFTHKVSQRIPKMAEFSNKENSTPGKYQTYLPLEYPRGYPNAGI